MVGTPVSNVARIDKDQMILKFAIVNMKFIHVYEVRKPDLKQVAIYIKQIQDSKRVKPILVDVEMHLLDGQCRYVAYKTLGFEGIAVSIAHFQQITVRTGSKVGKARRSQS